MYPRTGIEKVITQIFIQLNQMNIRLYRVWLSIYIVLLMGSNVGAELSVRS